ncbi:MAG: 4Fe-4S binding protein [Thermoleophilia bacterium]|nr:4Fe-4S binding protein [Thermoleophilia bacterium]
MAGDADPRCIGQRAPLDEAATRVPAPPAAARVSAPPVAAPDPPVTSLSATARPRPLRARKLALIARPEACTACGACIESCPRGAIEVGDIAAIDPALCIGCGSCVDACPNNVIEIETRSP